MIRWISVTTILFSLAISSTAQGQYWGVGPFGGVRIRSPFFSMDVPGPPVPPPFFVSPIPPRPTVVVPSYRYSVRSYPVYPYPSVQIEYGTPTVLEPQAEPTTEPATEAPNWKKPANLAQLKNQLWESATQLARSLSVRRDGEIWANYLMPNRIIAAIEQNNTASLAELTKHYDGVAANPQLAWLANLDGFAATRSLLHQYVQSPTGEAGQQANQPLQSEESAPADPSAEPEPPPTEPSDGVDDEPLPLPAPLPAPAPDDDVPTPAPPIKPADSVDA